METSININYKLIAEAISYMAENKRSQPGPEELATKLHLNPCDLQLLFRDWAGISPNEFMQFISVEYAKKILNGVQATLFDTAFETGPASINLQHDLFIKIEGMTPEEYRNGCENLHINYSFYDSIFGSLIVASTIKGVCFMAFEDDEKKALINLKRGFPNAVIQKKSDLMQQYALLLFQNNFNILNNITLHIKGTDFQLRVWESLLKIPMGKLTTYGNIANQIQSPKAARAVGTAIGSNPVAFLIPCHRVIQTSGKSGGYMWGQTRKKAIIGWEGAKTSVQW